MQPKLIVAFGGLSEPDFHAKAKYIAASLADNQNFKPPWLGCLFSLELVNAALASYETAYYASLTHDTLKIAERKKAREVLTDMLRHVAIYLELVAHGNVDMLATTGYDLRRDTTTRLTVPGEPLPAPVDFRVSHGTRSGTINLHAARLDGASSYHIEMAQGDPMQENNWHLVLTSSTCSRLTLEGFTPGQTYWLRLRGINSAGYGLWTHALSLMAV
jgi:hypothetical protein